jgi:hypothetical protein
MTSTAATFYDAASFGGRIYPLGGYRRAISCLLDGVVNGLGIVAAVCTTATVAAVSIINATLPINPSLHTTAPVVHVAIVFPNYYPTLAGAANSSGWVRVTTDSADALTFEARWVPATVLVSTGAAAPVPQPLVKRADNKASLQPNPTLPPVSRAEPEIAHASNSTAVAQLTSTTAPTSARRIALTPAPKLFAELDDSNPLGPRPAQHEVGRSSLSQSVPQVATTAPPPASIFERPVSPLQAKNNPTPRPNSDSRTAVYDISARTVYLPKGKRLEAHSGLGNMLDDPRYVGVKNRGPTPPNVYELTMREEIFHGVWALRLNPVGSENMFGRDGMLAHHYLRGADGQSNGCVSIKDYTEFLDAYLRGEVDRLVVVPHLRNTSWRTVSARVAGRRYADNNP